MSIQHAINFVEKAKREPALQKRINSIAESKQRMLEKVLALAGSLGFRFSRDELMVIMVRTRLFESTAATAIPKTV